jgi:hypothetical protein
MQGCKTRNADKAGGNIAQATRAVITNHVVTSFCFRRFQDNRVDKITTASAVIIECAHYPDYQQTRRPVAALAAPAHLEMERGRPGPVRGAGGTAHRPGTPNSASGSRHNGKVTAGRRSPMRLGLAAR